MTLFDHTKTSYQVSTPRRQSNVAKGVSMKYYFEIIRKRAYWWTRIKSRNGKILWASEMYTTKRNAEKPVLDLMRVIGKRQCSLKYIGE